ncbi:a-type inclusion protein [Anaeramoeba flamelloides]|uniref:A-type inclusion protein n=1 Tax=Anaeramoeba flamelloides TaxID=1746091 RepID=A0ABQ8XFN7_9EUKA|nr:a-type inclusion protein [Anaeramoeba flamelloides]
MGNQPSPLSKNKIKRYIKVVKKFHKPTIIFDVGARFVDLNSSALKMFKIKSKKKFNSVSLKDLCPEIQPHENVESVPFLTDWFHKTISSSSGKGDVMFNYLLPDKSDRWSLITLTKVEFSDITLGQLVFVAIKNPQNNKIKNIPEPLTDNFQSDFQSDGMVTSGKGQTTEMSQEETVSSENEYTIFSDESVQEIQTVLKDIKNLLTKSVENEEAIKLIQALLQKMENLHIEAIEYKESRRRLLSKRLEDERKENQEKMQQIEERLKRRIEGQESEKKLKQKLISENQRLKELCSKIKDFYNQNQSLLLNSVEENEQLSQLSEEITEKIQTL